MNKLRKLYFIGLFVLLLVPVSSLSAAAGTRYFVKSNSQFWKNAFNARHEFKDGFTADLNDWQIRFGKILGVSIEPVGILQILPDRPNAEIAPTLSSTPLAKPQSSEGTLSQGQDGTLSQRKATSGSGRLIPSDQTPWGIESVYNSSELTKTSGGEGVRVAVIDTGILANHPDLKNRIVKCKDFTSTRFPIVNGKCEDKNGHGTHVAGIIAADGGEDGLGIFGIAPAAGLYAFKACGPNGTCYADDVAVGIKTAVDDGANIINLSLGSDRPSAFIEEAVDYAFSKDTLVVAAAGNDGPYVESIDYPAADPKVLAVGAFGPLLKIADWSSRGINSKTTPLVIEEKDLELAAPGVNIESTWNNGGYAILSGTSMASPFVAGLAAKLWAGLDPLDPNPSQTVRGILHKTTMDIDLPGEDDSSGLGFFRLRP